MQRLYYKEKKLGFKNKYPIKQKLVILPKLPYWLQHVECPSIENYLYKYGTIKEQNNH